MNMRADIFRRLRCLAGDERGTQLVELAIVLPILLALFGATAEFGRFFYSYSTLAKATRSAARHLSTAPVQNGVNIQRDSEAKKMAVYGNPTGASATLLTGLSESNVFITRSRGTAGVPGRVTVEIRNYNYQPLFDLGKLTGGRPWLDIPLKPGTTMRYLINQPSV